MTYKNVVMNKNQTCFRGFQLPSRCLPSGEPSSPWSTRRDFRPAGFGCGGSCVCGECLRESCSGLSLPGRSGAAFSRIENGVYEKKLKGVGGVFQTFFAWNNFGLVKMLKMWIFSNQTLRNKDISMNPHSFSVFDIGGLVMPCCIFEW